MEERVLLVDDDPIVLDFLSVGLEMEGFNVITADSVSRAIIEVQKTQPSIILSDYQLHDGTAFDLLAWLKIRDFRLPVIVLTGQVRIDLAVEAIKNGAEQFIPKPVDLTLLTTMLHRALDNFRNLQKTVTNKLERARYERDPFLGVSPAIRELKKAAKRVAEANSTVLIQGETGTGKGVLARALHKMGSRSNEPFVDLNCAGLSRELLESELFGHTKGAFTGAVANKIGFLEAANHGTLFLDEIGDMPFSLQSKILRFLEQGEVQRLGGNENLKVDVRVIAATNADLKKRVAEQQFREDLYYRLAVFPIHLPPLRERMGDLEDLAIAFAGKFHPGVSLSREALNVMAQHAWPGNVRELRNAIERATILVGSEDEIKPEHIVL